jgi:hypothetical protein
MVNVLPANAQAFAVILLAIVPWYWDGLPFRTVTWSGVPGDPINLALEGTRDEVLAAFARIGTVPADPLSLRDDLRLAEDAVRHGQYPAAPVSRLFLFDRVEDFAVETEPGSVASRLHARFWTSGWRDAATGRALWLGAVSLDTGIGLLRRDHIPVGTTHHIYPDLDTVCCARSPRWQGVQRLVPTTTLASRC